MGWVKESDIKPEFGKIVPVYCRLYGKFFASYEYIGSFRGEYYGNWKIGDELGILPPIYWFDIPEPPQE